MYNESMYRLGSKRSTIREIFEYAKKRSAEIGAENVFDFSIGNPSVPAPSEVNEAIARLVQETPSVALHGYTSAQGDKEVREKIAANFTRRFGVPLSGDDLYMTCGAAASLTITLKALSVEGDEFIVFAPYFPEYAVFVKNAGAKLTVLPSNENMQPDFEALEKALSPKVKGVLINSPNNPSGVVYTEKTIKRLAKILTEKSGEYGAPIYLISDEPYRELVYDATTKVPCVMAEYENSIVCYSYSKSLSMPGERVGYIAVNPKMEENRAIYAAICGAGRSLGFVCAPALFQRVAAECDGLTADLSVYKRNRDLLYNALQEYGYTCVYPDGAFYLFVKALEEDAAAFCERAKKYELLLVNGADFGAAGWVRVAYCVQTERIEKALPLFKKLAEEYK
ncbi:MAG: pyridoxal phosphate-dependent aminotransferase [Clostridiales bacterium]|nr:pyridoxal phosphate-dependent aminotransferase [Clostridiales bacterium]